MSENPIKQILGDLLPYFEELEAKSSAILQLLRDKQIASDEELSHYLEHAAEASNVKWRAARVRFEHLFAASPDSTGKPKTETADKIEAKGTDDRSVAQAGDREVKKTDGLRPAKQEDQSIQNQGVHQDSEKNPAGVSHDEASKASAKSIPAAKTEESDLDKTELGEQSKDKTETSEQPNKEAA